MNAFLTRTHVHCTTGMMWAVLISSFPSVYCSGRERASLLSFTLFFSSISIEKGKGNRTWKVAGSSCCKTIRYTTKHNMSWNECQEERGMYVRDVMACEEKGKVLDRTRWGARWCILRLCRLMSERRDSLDGRKGRTRFAEYSSFPLCFVDVDVSDVMLHYFVWYSDHKLQAIGGSKSFIYRKGWKDSKE